MSQPPPLFHPAHPGSVLVRVEFVLKLTPPPFSHPPAGDVQPGQTQPAQCGGDQQHLPGAVAAGQPGLRHPDQALQRGRGGQEQPPDHHPQDSRWVVVAAFMNLSTSKLIKAFLHLFSSVNMCKYKVQAAPLR